MKYIKTHYQQTTNEIKVVRIRLSSIDVVTGELLDAPVISNRLSLPIEDSATFISFVVTTESDARSNDCRPCLLVIFTQNTVM